MKMLTIGLLLLLASFARAAELDSARELGFRDLRIIKGVLYEFGSAPPSSVVSGTVKRIAGDKVTLSNWERRMEVGEVPRRGTGTAGLLEELAISRLGNSPAQRLSMGASVRHVDVETETEVSNLENVRTGQKLAVRALRLEPKDATRWDAGVRFTGDLHQFKTVYQVTARGIIAVPIPAREKLEESAAKRNQALIESLTRNATNGFAFAQYELGWRYQKGEGAEIDLAKAKEWLEKAAAQGHVKAKSLLESLSKTGEVPQNPAKP